MKANAKNMLPWIIMGALGIFLIIGNQIAQDIFGKIFGAALLVAGIAGVIGWWRSKDKSLDATLQLVGSVVLGGVGLWALTKTEGFITFLNVALGLIIIAVGALNILRGWRSGRNVPTIVLGVLGVVLGLVIACNNAATTWVTIAGGIGLLYTAVTGLLGQRLS